MNLIKINSKLSVILLLVFIIFFNLTVLAVNLEQIPKLKYKVLNTHPHDPQAFTQGLEIYKDNLYEGTGLYGRSSLRKIKLASGKILKEINLNNNFFGEGITILNNKIYQLSWNENTAFVYDLNFNLIHKFKYQGEGWGLTNDNTNLIMSNGSKYLFFRNPKTFNIIKKIAVHNNNNEIKNINELEYLNGFVYANIWQTDYIIKINVDNGKIKSYLDLKNILNQDYDKKINVLNGIAYDKKNNSFLVTGKLWPKIFRIKIIK